MSGYPAAGGCSQPKIFHVVQSNSTNTAPGFDRPRRRLPSGAWLMGATLRLAVRVRWTVSIESCGQEPPLQSRWCCSSESPRAFGRGDDIECDSWFACRSLFLSWWHGRPVNSLATWPGRPGLRWGRGTREYGTKCYEGSGHFCGHGDA